MALGRVGAHKGRQAGKRESSAQRNGGVALCRGSKGVQVPAVSSRHAPKGTAAGLIARATRPRRLAHAQHPALSPSPPPHRRRTWTATNAHTCLATSPAPSPVQAHRGAGRAQRLRVGRRPLPGALPGLPCCVLPSGALCLASRLRRMHGVRAPPSAFVGTAHPLKQCSILPFPAPPPAPPASPRARRGRRGRRRRSLARRPWATLTRTCPTTSRTSPRTRRSW